MSQHIEKSDDSDSPTSSPPSLDVDERREEKPQQLTTHQSLDKPSVPLGGARAWLQVLGGFFAFINIW